MIMASSNEECLAELEELADAIAELTSPLNIVDLTSPKNSVDESSKDRMEVQEGENYIFKH